MMQRLEAGYSLVEILLVVGLTSVIAAISIPMMKNTMGDFKVSGDARGLTNAVSLAKMRAAADFSQARLYVDLNANSYRVETWQKAPTSAWATEGGVTALSTGDAFSLGLATVAPANTQTTIGQPPACLTALGAAVGNTACILFNSRGIPVDTAGVPPAIGAPTGNDAVYLTDGVAIFSVTVSATGLVKLWRANSASVPAWVLQ